MHKRIYIALYLYLIISKCVNVLQIVSYFNGRKTPHLKRIKAGTPNEAVRYFYSLDITQSRVRDFASCEDLFKDFEKIFYVREGSIFSASRFT